MTLPVIRLIIEMKVEDAPYFRLNVGKMFYGRYEHKIDAKGRLQIPIALRECDRETTPSDKVTYYRNFIMLKGSGNCLSLVPTDEFFKTAREFKPEYDAKGVVNFSRRLFPNIFEVQLDNQGRIIIPKHLREFAGLEDKVLVLGVGSWVEIWNEELYERACANSEIDYDEIADLFFSNLGRKKFGEKANEPAD